MLERLTAFTSSMSACRIGIIDEVNMIDNLLEIKNKRELELSELLNNILQDFNQLGCDVELDIEVNDVSTTDCRKPKQIAVPKIILRV